MLVEPQRGSIVSRPALPVDYPSIVRDVNSSSSLSPSIDRDSSSMSHASFLVRRREEKVKITFDDDRLSLTSRCSSSEAIRSNRCYLGSDRTLRRKPDAVVSKTSMFLPFCVDFDIEVRPLILTVPLRVSCRIFSTFISHTRLTQYQEELVLCRDDCRTRSLMSRSTDLDRLSSMDLFQKTNHEAFRTKGNQLERNQNGVEYLFDCDG